MKSFLKILAVGIITTICRLMFQLLIPDTVQTILPPSVFVESGTLPLIFSVYAFFAYGILTALFFLVFNGFMLLVFDFSKADLALRTGVDILTISLGLWLSMFFNRKKIERNIEK